MITPTHTLRRSFLATATFAALAVFCLNTASVRAADRIWTGGGGGAFDWTNAANWDEAVAAGDSLIFDGTVGTANNNDFANGTAFFGITFADLSDPFTLNGNDVLLSGNTAGVVSGVTNLSLASAQTVNLNLLLDWGRHLFSGGTAGLALNGTVTANTGSTANFDALGTVTSTSLTQNASNGLITGLGATALMRDGNNNTGLATISGGTIRAYDYALDPGAMELASGEITGTTVNTNLNLTGAAATTYTVAVGDQVINTIRSDNGPNDQIVQLNDGQTLRFANNGGLIYTGTVNNGGALQIRGSGAGSMITAGDAVDQPGTLVFSSNGNGTSNPIDIGTGTVSIVDNGIGVVTVVKTGLGSMVLRSASTYSGGTYINEGYLQLNNQDALGTGPVFISGNQSTLSLQNIPGGGVVDNDITLSPGIGFTGGTSSWGALRLGNNDLTLTGTITVTGAPVEIPDADSGNRIAQSSANLGSIEGQITGTGTLNLFGANANAVITLANPLGNNNWQGGLIISQQDAAEGLTVRLGAANQIPDGVSAGNVTLIQNGDATVALDLNGNSETINGLNSGGVGAGAILVINSLVATTSTLTVGAGDADGTFGGVLQDGAGVLALTKTGVGAQVLSGVNTYTGATAINGGTLTLDATGALAGTTSVAVTAGTLILQNASSLNDAVTLSLVTGTTLNLDFIGAEQIFALTLSGSDIPIGVYTAPQLSLLDPTINFAGTGALAVIPEPGVVALALIGISVVLLNARRRRMV
jgi:fibronectin-binding autotransporter adhesin